MNWKNRRKTSGFRISRNKILWVTLILFITAGLFFSVRSNIFTIKSVDVKLDKIACADAAQIKDTSALYGTHILFFDLQKIKNTLKNKFVCIKDIDITRRFPDRANLSVWGREPKSILVSFKEIEASTSAEVEIVATPSARIKETKDYLVDEDSIIFSRDIGSAANLPKIYIPFELTLGQVPSPQVPSTLKILDKIKLYGLETTESEIKGAFLIIYPQPNLAENTNTPRIIFNLEGDIDTQLASLQLILNKAKIDFESLRFIDLRFDKPIIKIAPKKS